MHKCDYCELDFASKKLLQCHQKTKKCTVHRRVRFTCEKCFASFKGYENLLNHINKCDVVLSADEALAAALKETLRVFGRVPSNNTDLNTGILKFEKPNLYTHLKPVEEEEDEPLLAAPTISGYAKILKNYSTKQLADPGNLTLNDCRSKALRISDRFQIESVRSDFQTLMKAFWLSTPNAAVRKIDGVVHVLDRVQCQNSSTGRKWTGDTGTTRPEETVIKCVWRKDPEFKKFYAYLRPLVMDVFNLYMSMGAQALKKKRVYFKGGEDPKTASRTIASAMDNLNLKHLVDNLKILGDYDVFRECMKRATMVDPHHTRDALYTNIEHVFEEAGAKSSPAAYRSQRWSQPDDVDQFYSLMTMREHHDLLHDRVDYLLVYHVLADDERLLFLSKN